MYIRHPYERIRVQTPSGGESKTQQAHKDQTDINAIIARFDRTGVLPGNPNQGVYADCTDLQTDLTEALQRTQEVLERATQFKADWTPQPQQPTESPQPDPDPGNEPQKEPNPQS